MECHCRLDVCAKGTTIRIDDLERVETRVVASVVLWILGNNAFHHIISGQMMLVESVLSETYYGWAQMMLSQSGTIVVSVQETSEP